MQSTIIRLIILVFLIANSKAEVQNRPEDISPSAFAGLEGFVGAQISPDGDRLAYLYPLNGRRNLVVHTFATGNNTLIPPIDKLNFNWLHWANNQRIVFSMSYSAARHLTDTVETRLISVDVVSKEITPLVRPAQKTGRTGSRTAREYYAEAQIQDDVIEWMLDDPDHILVSLDENFDGADEVRKINVNTGAYETAHRSSQGIQYWMVDHSGAVRFGYGYRDSEFRAALKSATGEWITLGKTDWYQDGWFPRGFTTDPSVIYVTGPGEHGTREVRTLNIDEGTFLETIYADDKFDAGGIVNHPLTDRPAGVRFVTHTQAMRYFDRELDQLQKSIDRALPDTNNRIASMTHDQRKILIESASAQEPGVLLIWDRNAQSIDPFGWFMEAIDPEMMSPVKPVEYESADGTVIPAYLTLPLITEHTGLPVVVMPHGGPASRDDQSFWFLSQFLASRGYAVLQPNYRGSTGYGYDYERAGRGQWGGLMQDDVTAGVNWLIEQGIADKNRVCIMGWSYGGYSAAIGLVKTPELYRCGISINGVYNLPQFIVDDKKYIGGSVWTRHMGLDGENAKTVSPYHQVERIQSPLLIIHAEDDGRVQVSQADNMYRQLIRKNKKAKLVKVALGGHSMVNEAARLTILSEVETFLQENIGAR